MEGEEPNVVGVASTQLLETTKNKGVVEGELEIQKEKDDDVEQIYRCPSCKSENITEEVDALDKIGMQVRIKHNPNIRQELDEIMEEGYHDFDGTPQYSCEECGSAFPRPIIKEG